MSKLEMYTSLAKYYDKIYHRKDYEKEVDFLEQVFRKFGRKVNDILDVACGTGNHDVIFADRGYSITGVDLNKEMIKIARRKVRQAKYLVGDMRSFDLGKQFDAILCLFSAIDYNTNVKDMKEALSNFYRHLRS